MSSRNSCRTKVIGLTGGIASGKNFVAEIFAKKGAVVFDADKEVHNLLEFDKSTIDQVRKQFPESFIDEKIDRKILGKAVFANEDKLRILEKILHPKVRKKYREFVIGAKKDNKKFVVLNVPSLLETKAYKSDFVIAIVAPLTVRKKRFMARSKNSDLKTFNQIRAKQMTDLERKKHADFVIKNDKTREAIEQQVDIILQKI